MDTALYRILGTAHKICPPILIMSGSGFCRGISNVGPRVSTMRGFRATWSSPIPHRSRNGTTINSLSCGPASRSGKCPDRPRFAPFGLRSTAIPMPVSPGIPTKTGVSPTSMTRWHSMAAAPGRWPRVPMRFLGRTGQRHGHLWTGRPIWHAVLMTARGWLISSAAFKAIKPAIFSAQPRASRPLPPIASSSRAITWSRIKSSDHSGSQPGGAAGWQSGDHHHWGLGRRCHRAGADTFSAGAFRPRLGRPRVADPGLGDTGPQGVLDVLTGFVDAVRCRQAPDDLDCGTLGGNAGQRTTQLGDVQPRLIFDRHHSVRDAATLVDSAVPATRASLFPESWVCVFAVSGVGADRFADQRSVVLPVDFRMVPAGGVLFVFCLHRQQCLYALTIAGCHSGATYRPGH